jgi:hypothetical protein
MSEIVSTGTVSSASSPAVINGKGRPHVRVGVGCFVRHEHDNNRFLVGKRKGSHGEGKLALPGKIYFMLLR